jgi:protein-S-isoprenylcysteine O-methyltransferase Ste14
MPDLFFKIIYLAGLVVELAIRAPFNRWHRQNKIVTTQLNRREVVVLLLLLLGNLVLPVIYTFTPWLTFADYQLPDWTSWLGVVILVGALLVFWRSHVDLGQNWSPSLQIREGHSLITNGLYRYIRHPMYASQWLWVIAQVLLLQNWIAGVGGLILFLPMYFIRVPQEEQMMIDQFGEAYRIYKQHTGRVLPRWPRT